MRLNKYVLLKIVQESKHGGAKLQEWNLAVLCTRVIIIDCATLPSAYNPTGPHVCMADLQSLSTVHTILYSHLQNNKLVDD